MIGVRAVVCSLALAMAAASSGPAARAQVWEVGNRLLTAVPPADHEDFGYSLAAGDFDGDGRDDLAVGVRHATVQGIVGAGRIDIFLSTSGRRFAAPIRVPLSFAEACHVGYALVAGNFDDTPALEIGFGAPDCSGGWAGMVAYRGSGQFFLSFFAQAALPGGDSEDGDRFGAALAAGDFDHDGFDDLAIGAPGESLAAGSGVGSAHVVFGTATGLDAVHGQTIEANGLSAGSSTGGDNFGAALAAGSFDGDLFDDLAIGAPGRTVSFIQAGALQVAYGSAAGITAAGSQTFTDASFGYAPELGDKFASVLAAGNFDAFGAVLCLAGTTACADDLVIGVPDEDINDIADAGKLIVARGIGGGGLTTAGFLGVDQGVLGYNIEAFDRFASALAAGRLDSRRFSDASRWATDLVVGAPFESFLETSDGVAHLLFGASGSGLSTATSQFQAQLPGYETSPPETGDRFGKSLAIGDFDGDGTGDLAVGITEKTVDGVVEAGAVQILYGGIFADGLERQSPSSWSSTVNP